LVEFTVVGRGGYETVEAPLALPELSSTEVRARLARGESVAALVDARVVDYIQARGLYSAGPAPDGR
jgi:nicotinate-nucleotide adenylyltransferase